MESLGQEAMLNRLVNREDLGIHMALDDGVAIAGAFARCPRARWSLS